MSLDASLTFIRDLLNRKGGYDAEIRLRADGRMWIEIIDQRGITVAQVAADLNPDSAIVAPSEAMRRAFGEDWSEP